MSEHCCACLDATPNTQAYKEFENDHAQRYHGCANRTLEFGMLLHPGFTLLDLA